MSNIDAVATGLLFALVISASKKNYILKSIHDIKRPGIGEVVYPLGIALSALIIWPLSIIAYQGSCLILGLSDGLAGYIGNKYGKRVYSVIGGSKTVEGSVIFLYSTIVIFLIYYFFRTINPSVWGIGMVFIYGIGITLIEAVFSDGWDNLIIPIASGLALLLILS